MGKQKFVFLFLIFLVVGAYAQTSEKTLNVDGEGQFLSRPSDDWQFVKKNLFTSAIEDIYSKVLTESGLDKELFWKKYEARFAETFKPTEEELKKKYGFEDGQNLEKRPKFNQYETELREARANLRAKFGALSRAIVGYSEKRQSRSTTNPNIRFLTLGTKVDPAAINAAYYRFTSDNKTRNINSILLVTTFSLRGVEWKDLGVNTPTDFTNVVEEYWRKWLEDTLKAQVGEVKILSPSQAEEIQGYLKSGNNVNDQLGPQDQGRVPSEYVDSLLMKIQVIMEGQGTDDSGSGINIKISGDHVLVDLKTKDIIHSQDFTEAVHKFGTPDAQTLSSNVASTVYRIPMSSWEGIGKSIATLPETNGNIILAIQKVSSVSHIYSLIDFLAQKGAGQGFQGKLEWYDGQQAKILLRYQGDADKVVELIKKLQDVDVTKSLTLHFDDLSRPFVMSLRAKAMSEGEKAQ